MAAHVVPAVVFVAVLAVAAGFDVRRRVVPNALTVGGAVAGVVLVVAFDSRHLAEHLIAAAAAGGGFLIVALVHPRGMGMGDVKLAAVLGLYLGAAVVPAVLVALLAGTLAGAVIAARCGLRAARTATLPFAPFLALGGVAALVV
jgi:leader peptidase (prepilin peptidase)/N-methyltransferase